MKPLMNTIQTLISTKKSTNLQEIFEDVKVRLGYKQPPGIGTILTRAKFQDPTSSSENRRDLEPGIFAECQDFVVNYVKCTYNNVHHLNVQMGKFGKLNAI